MANPSDDAKRLVREALTHHRSNNPAAAEALYRQALALAPNEAEAAYYLGVLLFQTGRIDRAIDALQKAGQAAPHNAAFKNDLGAMLKAANRLAEAEECYRRSIELDPNRPDTYSNLANTQRLRGNFASAEENCRKALTLKPDFPQACCNLGLILLARDKTDDALRQFENSVALDPNFADGYSGLGLLHQKCNRVDDALAAYRKCLALNPRHENAHLNTGLLLRERGDFPGAIRALETAATLNPHNACAYNNLGIIHADSNDFAQADACYRKALLLAPEIFEPYSNLGSMLKSTGRLDEAEAAFKKAVELRPDNPEALSNYAFLTLYRPEKTDREIFAAHRLWGERIAGPSRTHERASDNRNPDPHKILKIGYVSPDFKAHSVAFFFESIIRHHDPKKCETYCYSNVRVPDRVTEKIRAAARNWRDIAGLSDPDACAAIRRDEIDILVDLAGHTAGNRLPIFSARPAPLQVSYLGYPTTTGLPAIDYRLTDHFADPPGQDEFHCETLYRLAPGFLCYAPPEAAPDPTAELPPQTVFGSFNFLPKINAEVVRLWSRLLHAAPDSRLVLKSRPFADPTVRERFHAAFGKEGVNPERVELHGFADSLAGHLENYRKISVALDTFPYNGTTTTCEALWMGVPVVTLAGNRHAARTGVSILTQLELTELIANSQDEYVSATLALAANRAALVKYRTTLRDRMRKSPLCDTAGFTARLEQAYRDMWLRHCRHEK